MGPVIAMSEDEVDATDGLSDSSVVEELDATGCEGAATAMDDETRAFFLPFSFISALVR